MSDVTADIFDKIVHKLLTSQLWQKHLNSFSFDVREIRMEIDKHLFFVIYDRKRNRIFVYNNVA